MTEAQSPLALLARKRRTAIAMVVIAAAVFAADLVMPTAPAHAAVSFIVPTSGGVNAYWGRYCDEPNGRSHAGIDIEAPKGTPVVAAEQGTVTYTGWDPNTTGWGNYVEITHSDGYSTRYAHLSATSVTAGQVVGRGQKIGEVGKTGEATGEHLHWEVMFNGVRVEYGTAYFTCWREVSTGAFISGGSAGPSSPDDYVIYRATAGLWYPKAGPTGSTSIPGTGVGIPHGGWTADRPMVGDFDTDNVDDLVIVRTVNQVMTWYVKSGATGAYLANGSSGVVHGGQPGDLPFVGDFNADGIDDLGIYRVVAGAGTWYVKAGPNGASFVANGNGLVHGGHPGDVPVVGDFNNDGYADYGIYRAESGTWYVRSGSTLAYLPNLGGGAGMIHGGHPGDLPIVGDFNGDGFDDPTIYRVVGGAGTWFVRSGACGCWDANIANASNGFIHGGWTVDVPLVGDVNGDGKDDFVLYRVDNGAGTWYGKSGPSGAANIPSSGSGVVHGGHADDIPLIGNFG